MNERILISGASVAGLTLAYWLARYGFRPTVVERAPGLREGGQGIDVRGPAVEVVERMGILPSVRAVATDVRGVKFVDAEDRAVARIGTEDPSGVEIMRGDLVALLHETARSGVEYVFGDSVSAAAQDDSGVTVTFERGGTRRFDLVVGADGLHSTTRRLAFGPEARFLHHHDHYFAFADAEAALGEDRWVTMFNQPGRMAGIYRSGHHAQAKAYFIFRSGPLAYDHRDTAQQKQLVRQAFADGAWRTGELLATALDDPDFYFDALAQVRMDSWSTGRVALLGDAAWCASPASGAGAELALVGAYRLAGELAAAGGDHRLAFARYHAGLRPLVRQRQQIGLNLRVMVPRTAGGRRVRDAFARLPLARPLGTLERLGRAGNRRALPEYAPAR